MAISICSSNQDLPVLAGPVTVTTTLRGLANCGYRHFPEISDVVERFTVGQAVIPV
jgi:hypothetical protein